MRWFIIFVGAFLFISSNSQATRINIPEDYLTIQEGIDSTNDGDTVLVQPGTYYENINFNGHNIVLGSLFLFSRDSSLIASTIIDGSDEGYVIRTISGEDTTAVIKGFTIQKGKSGIVCRDSDPIIINNLITDNHSYSGYGSSGGGIFCSNSQAHILNNLIYNNRYSDGYPGGESEGGGIYCQDSNPIIRGNLIFNNKVYGYYGAWGGGIYCENSNPIITNNTVSHNVLNSSYIGIHCNNSNPSILNCIIWEDVLYANSNSSPTVTYCDIKGGWEGEGNFDEDPLFVSTYYNNYNVYLMSPCIDRGDPEMTDPDGSRSDIGAFFFDHPTMGNRWYISNNGNDSTGNGSQANPFETIQHAIDNSFLLDTIVAENGLYRENLHIEGRIIFVTSNYTFSEDTLDIYNTKIEGFNVNEDIVSIINCDSLAILSGFTVEQSHNRGIKCDHSDPKITFNLIQNNGDSGIRCTYSDPYIGFNTIKANSADSGGGISCRNSHPIIISNRIVENTANDKGGGIHCFRSHPQVLNNSIMNNSATNQGGGICLHEVSHAGLVDNNIISHNISDSHGGGIYCYKANATISNNKIFHNEADRYGAGIHARDGETTIRNNQIKYNRSSHSGGGIVLHEFNHVIFHNVIIGNSADNGAGIYSHESQCQILNNTILSNRARDEGGGICCGWSHDIILNSIIGGNNAPNGSQISSSHGQPFVTYCNIEGGWEEIGNIDVDPLFRDPENDDFHLMAIECGDPQDSPCIDAGHPAFGDSLLDCDWGLGTIRSDIGAFGGVDSLPFNGNRIIYVPDEYSTIQEALDASWDNDTVIVRPGMYGKIDFRGHNIILGSMFLLTNDSTYITETIINGDNSGSAVTFMNSFDSVTTICGFTIENGNAEDGGGIHCKRGVIPNIYSNRIINNNADRFGGGIYCNNAHPKIRSNVINNNSAPRGGGIACWDTSNAVIDFNIISDNFTYGESYGMGAGIYCELSGPLINNNYIQNNSANKYGGGVACFSGNLTMLGNNIISNSAVLWGGGLIFLDSDAIIYNNNFYLNDASAGGGTSFGNSTLRIINNIYWSNSAQNHPAIFRDYLSDLIITHNDIQGGWEGEGNIDVDPLFRDPENGDYHLMATYCDDPYNSPCIDMGNPSIFDSLLDCDWGLGEERSDMGAYAGDGRLPTDINEDITLRLPTVYRLSQNYPNPFNNSTTIKYALPFQSEVRVEVYNILGQQVETILNAKQNSGYHTVNWNASGYSSGIYFYRLTTGDKSFTKRMTLLK
ncbi:MAG: T9SS type A sorting domain-containing protein [candidate division Zixibacteria bacterium]|nr:T9SS type A sorting domain-containing protein [candidate division Zixibacteria bacterium]